MQARENFGLLQPVAERFVGKPLRQVAIWCLGFIMPFVGDLDVADREWLAAALHRAADFMLEAHRN